MAGIRRRSAWAATAGPVSPEPVMATAPALTSRSNCCAARVAEALSLYHFSVNLRPSTPPLALRSLTAMSAPWTIACPVVPYAPVVPAISPIRIDLPPPPDEEELAQAASAAADRVATAATL